MKSTTLTRRELYDLVWSTPLTTLAKKYGIQDARLRKICVEMNVPLPKAGHWEKLRAGKEVEVFELPEDYSGKEETTFEISSQENVSIETPLQRLMSEIENDLESFLIVPDTLFKPDELVALASQKLKSMNVSGGYVSSREIPLNIDVTPVNLDRALRFMNAFIKLTRERGHKIVIKDKKAKIVVNGEELPMEVRETKKRVLTPNNYGYRDATDSPSGILCFRVWKKFYRTVEWKDGRLPIEKQLSKILASLEILSEEMKEYQRKLEEGWAEQAKKEKIRKDLEKRKADELSEFKKLLQSSKRWQEVTFIRKYIDEVERLDTGKEKSEWINWARKKADWFDPTIEAEDELLQHIKRDNISFENKPDPFLLHGFKNYY